MKMLIRIILSFMNFMGPRMKNKRNLWIQIFPTEEEITMKFLVFLGMQVMMRSEEHIVDLPCNTIPKLAKILMLEEDLMN